MKSRLSKKQLSILIGVGLGYLLCCLTPLVAVVAGALKLPTVRPTATKATAASKQTTLATATVLPPTLADTDTCTPSETALPTDTFTPSDTPLPTVTFTLSPSLTLTLTATSTLTSTPRPTLTFTQRPTYTYAPVIPPAPTARYCCRYCSKGKPCGDSCINRSYTCHQPPGCAC